MLLLFYYKILAFIRSIFYVKNTFEYALFYMSVIRIK